MRRLQWFRDKVLPQIGLTIRNCIAMAKKEFSTLSPGQLSAVSRQAYRLLLQYIRPQLDPILDR